jgi:hypothetical protein
MNSIRTIVLAGVSQLVITTALAAPENAVIRANAAAGVAATSACMAPLDNPFHESRAYAMMHLAIHDALNAIDRRYQPYAYDKTAESGTSADAAVAAAAYYVLSPTIQKLPAEVLPNDSCVPNGKAVVDAAYVLALAVIPDGPAKTQGVALGKTAAAAVLEKRANDHADDGGPFINKTCPPAGAPGAYQCTPGFPFVAFEKWESVTPFVMQDNAQFRPGPPYTVNDAKFKADLEEVKKLGGDGKTTPSTRTPEQSEIALFWLESSPLKWSRIGRTVAADKGLDMWDSARLFAILEMALTDGYIAMAASKNHYNFWRPVTAIHANGDASWSSFVPTPPDQDYPSGHSIEAGAGAEVLKRLVGTDQVNFKDCGATLPAGSTCYDEKPVLRSYTSFTQAADENAISRVYVGFHFRNATVEGTAYGRKIGERAATLLPAAK